tara:strand:- start:597 stop:833 length:237 start_codon:yes stop_codon:yes gene_type:complete
VDGGDLVIGQKAFNYNTLEPKLVKANSLEAMNLILGKDYKTVDELHKYMKGNKTECALKIFETTGAINYPQYILDALE